MSGSINKVILVGNLGRDPEIRTLNSGDRVANLSIATSETWRDRNSGERKERTEWHRVVIFNDNLVKVAENYLRKGSKVYIEGALQTRKYEQGGQEKYSTEVVGRRRRARVGRPATPAAHSAVVPGDSRAHRAGQPARRP